MNMKDYDKMEELLSKKEFRDLLELIQEDCMERMAMEVINGRNTDDNEELKHYKQGYEFVDGYLKSFKPRETII